MRKRLTMVSERLVLTMLLTKDELLSRYPSAMTNADAIDISNDTYVGDFDVVVVDIIHDSYIYVDVTYRTPFQTTIHLSFDADGVMFDDVDERSTPSQVKWDTEDPNQMAIVGGRPYVRAARNAVMRALAEARVEDGSRT